MQASPGRILMACAAVALPAVWTQGSAQAAKGLRAGAARVDITPAVADLPAPFKTVHDPIYVRALVIDDGATRAAIVVGDLPTIAVAEFDDLKRRIAETAHAPAQNVLLAVTHSHSAVRVDHVEVGISLPGSPRIADMTISATVDAVKRATAGLRPARAAYANGTPAVAAGLPPPPAEPVDRSIGVLKFEAVTGEPIAFVFNSDLPGVGGAPEGDVGAGAAGAVERYIEQRYGDKAVAIYTKGASSPAGANAGARGGPPTDPYARLTAMGSAVGQEVLALAERARPMPAVKISGAAQVVQCPGKSTTPLNLPNRCSDAAGSKLPACKFTDTDIEPVKLQVGLLRIGELNLVQADADITQPVWQRLKAASPPNTALVSLVYGPVHYVLEDSVYPSNSYQVTASMAKAGCAADGFVNSASALLRR